MHHLSLLSGGEKLCRGDPVLSIAEWKLEQFLPPALDISQKSILSPHADEAESLAKAVFGVLGLLSLEKTCSEVIFESKLATRQSYSGPIFMEARCILSIQLDRSHSRLMNPPFWHAGRTYT